MNWTEGNLARHSRGKARNEVLNRQKQHFAEARNKLLNRNGIAKISPPSISFLKEKHARQSGHRLREHSSPLLQPRRSKPPWHKSPSNRLHDEGYSRDRDEGSTYEPLDQHDDLPTKRNKRPLSHFFEADGSRHSSDLAKRRRLLQKADWAGLSTQQPIDMVFPGQLEASSGRLWNKASRSKGKPKQSPPRITTKHRVEADTESRHWRKDDTHKRTALPIRIMIGSQEINPSVSSQLPTMGRTTNSAHLTSLPPITWTQTLDKQHNKPPPTQYARSHSQHRYQERKEFNARQRGSLLLRYPVATREDESATQQDPIYTVYSSSSMIHEPVPLRAGLVSFLEADYPAIRNFEQRSEDSGSMVGQAECIQPKDPIQVRDSKRWKMQLLSSDNEILSLTRGSSAFRSPRFRPATVSPWLSDAKAQNGVAEIPDAQGNSAEETSNSPQLYASVYMEIEQPVTSASPVKAVGVSRTESSSYLPSSPPNLQTEVASKPPQIKTTDQMAKERTREEDSNVWMKFVLDDDDSEELEELVFKEAARKAVQEMKPADTVKGADHTSLSSEECLEIETIATCGIFLTTSHEDEVDSQSVAAISASHVACHGSESSWETEAPDPRILFNATDRVSTKLQDTIPQSDSNLSFSRSTISAPMAVSSDPEIDKAGNPDSNSRTGTIGESQEAFRFSKPRTFVGKHATSGKQDKAFLIQPPVRRKGKGAGGRRHKEPLDGRVDIRGLAAFDGDPIEEIDEG